MVPAIIHTHAGNEYVKRAGALYTPRVYRGRILHIIVLTTLNKQAFARCEIYAHMPSCLEQNPWMSPIDASFENTHTHTHTHTHTQSCNKLKLC